PGPACGPSCGRNPTRAGKRGRVMAKTDSADERYDDRASPTQITSPVLRLEAKRALVWVAIVGMAVLAIYIAQALLVIFGAMVFAAMLDGGARLLGRILPIGRGLRIGLVLLVAVLFLVWLGYFAGSQISREAAQLPQSVSERGERVVGWLDGRGFAIAQAGFRGMASQLMSGVGTVTRAIGGIVGAFTTLFLIAITGIYVAPEPRLYERGLAW